MSLSQRAKEYIQLMLRNQDWQSAPQVTTDFLNRLGLDPTDELVEFQEKYSGLELTIKNQPKSTFKAFLFSENQIRNSESPDPIKLANSILYDCGQHATAQIAFFLSDTGEFCTIDDDDLPNVLKSSFALHIEEYALRNEIADWEVSPPYYQLKKSPELLEYMSRFFEPIHECSDEYCSWWGNENLRVTKGVWLDRDGDHDFYLHIYGREKAHCENLVEELKHLGII